MTVTMTGPHPSDLFIPSVATISSVQGCPTTPRVVWELISYPSVGDRQGVRNLISTKVPDTFFRLLTPFSVSTGGLGTNQLQVGGVWGGPGDRVRRPGEEAG